MRFWKMTAVFSVVGIFYVGHGLHQGGAMSGESVAAAQVQDQRNITRFMSPGALGKPHPNPPLIGKYQIIWVPPDYPTDSSDFGIRRLNTATGEVDFPMGALGQDRNGKPAPCMWTTLAIKP